MVRRVVTGLQATIIGAGIIVTGFCIPYLVLPSPVMDQARQEFAKTYGASWESQVTEPASGPWLKYSIFTNMHGSNIAYNKSAFSITRDVIYLTHDNDSFRCDVYAPTGIGPFPVIINMHGGGWLGGDKDSIIGYQIEYLAAAGYLVFSVQYGAIAEAGISRQYSMQEILDNMATFSDWLAMHSQVSKYKLDLTTCFVLGLSAGGHLSAILSVGRFNLTTWNPAVNLVGGIDFYGITDIQNWNMISASWLNSSGLFNDTVLSDFNIVEPYSPVNYVRSTTENISSIIPLLIFHGDADTVVPVNQSRYFDALSDARGLKCTYIELPGAPHVFEGRKDGAGAYLSLWAMERFLQLCF